MVANVKDQFRNQFIIKTILIINLVTNYKCFELFWLQNIVENHKITKSTKHS